jgi:voltage-gated potassium channel
MTRIALAPLTSSQIEHREAQFPLFLVATVLPLLALPMADLQGGPLQRYGLPFTIDLLILQSLRAMPSWHAKLGGLRFDRIYRWLGILGAINIWIPFVLGHNVPWALRGVFVGIRACFFLLTGIRIIQVLAASSRVTSKTLCLAAAGYIHMGLTCGQLATALQVIDSDSFKLGAMLNGEELVSRLSYFAFVTIGTLGYGDVVPASPIGECFVVLMSIASTLYVSLLIGLLLSRYIDYRTKVVLRDIGGEATR